MTTSSMNRKATRTRRTGRDAHLPRCREYAAIRTGPSGIISPEHEAWRADQPQHELGVVAQTDPRGKGRARIQATRLRDAGACGEAQVGSILIHDDGSGRARLGVLMPEGGVGWLTDWKDAERSDELTKKADELLADREGAIARARRRTARKTRALQRNQDMDDESGERKEEDDEPGR